MIQITNVKIVPTNDGKELISFVIEGGIELVQSATTSKFYAKGKKALLNTSLSKSAAEAMIGSSIPGSIQRVPSEPYEYVIKETGEKIMLHHSYTYSPEEAEVTIAKSDNFRMPFGQAEAIA